MAVKKTGLGRGIDAIFADNAVEEISPGAGVVKLGIADITPNRNQPRKQFDEEALSELSESISQHGLLQPLLVRAMSDGGYQLVAGERRWRACRMAGLKEVPVVIRELTDAEVAEVALVENLQREDLNPMEEAMGFKDLCDNYGCTQDEVAKLLGRSRPSVANALRLLNLPDSLQRMVAKGELSAGHARALLTVTDAAVQAGIAARVVRDGLSVRETERLSRLAVKTAPAATGKRTKKRNPYYDEIELSLGDVLGRRVRVSKSSKRGSLEIEFFDDEDLKKLLKLFDEE